MADPECRFTAPVRFSQNFGLFSRSCFDWDPGYVDGAEESTDSCLCQPGTCDLGSSARLSSKRQISHNRSSWLILAFPGHKIPVTYWHVCALSSWLWRQPQSLNLRRNVTWWLAHEKSGDLTSRRWSDRMRA